MSTTVIAERNVPCTMRDGTILYANIYRPDTETPVPVLVTRLPYDKDLTNFSHRYIDPIQMADNGYAVVIQDVRGRFASEGEFTPFVQEEQDGYDTVEWAASLPFCNGGVGMFGLSYYGFTQMYAAKEQPPSLRAIFPAFTGNDVSRGMGIVPGKLDLGKGETWFLDSVAPDFLERHGYSEALSSLKKDLENIFEWYSYAPVQDFPPLAAYPELLDMFRKYIDGTLTSSMEDPLPYISTPGFHMAGWFDCFLDETITNYKTLAEGEHTQKLIVGPWGHGTFSSYFGDRFFGLNASMTSRDITDLHLEWFDLFMRGKRDELPAVRYFTMGTNEWKEATSWPPTETVYTPLYLSGNGTLSWNITSTEEKENFRFDPSSPTPTTGGRTLFHEGINTGPLKQNDVEKRNDGPIHTSAPLDEDIEITGPLSFELTATSDVMDTDFTVVLTEVLPNGDSIFITEGIIRTSTYVQDASSGFHTYEIPLSSTSIHVRKGHRLRVRISSSSFPQYDVNLNTGKTMLTSTEHSIAEQTIRLSDSKLILPLLPSSPD